MAQLLVLARLLVKVDFALFALVNIVLSIFIQLVQSGFQTAIIHYQPVSGRQLSSLFWLNLLSGLVLGLLMVLAGPLLAWIFQAPALSGLYAFSGLILFVLGWSATPRALLHKNLDFSGIAYAQISAVLLSFVLAVVLALRGWGAYALAGALLARYTLEGLMCFLFSSFRPAWHFHLEDVRFFLRFGGFQAGERLITHLAGQLDTILIGKFLGMEALGGYDLMKRVLVRPSNLLSELVERVAFPTMARIQSRRAGLRRFYLKVTGHILTLNFWAYGLAFVLSGPLTGLLFGPQWAPWAGIFQLLCLYVMLNSITNPLDSLLLAIGRIDYWLYINLAFLPVLALAIGLGLPFGLAATTGAILLAHLLLIGLSYVMALSPLLEMKVKNYFGALGRPASGVMPLIAIGWLLMSRAGEQMEGPLAVVISLVFAAFFLFLNREAAATIRGLIFKS